MAPGSAPPPPAQLAPTVAGASRVLCCHKAVLSGQFLANSLDAVRECVEAHVPRFEIDARFLSDDRLLVFHDERLDGETTASGPVAALDAAAAGAIRFRADDRVALAFLDEVVDLVAGSDSLLQVDLKGLATLSAAQVARLASTLWPARDQVLIGSQAHWNLWALHEHGFRVAFDPTLQWHYRPARTGEGLSPARMGVHGLWDDSPLAQLAETPAGAYLEARVKDLIGLLPAAEWMVDYGTLLHMRSQGFELGERLRQSGIGLAAWTVKDEGKEATLELLSRLFGLGAETVITESARDLAHYLADAA